MEEGHEDSRNLDCITSGCSQMSSGTHFAIKRNGFMTDIHYAHECHIVGPREAGPYDIAGGEGKRIPADVIERLIEKVPPMADEILKYKNELASVVQKYTCLSRTPSYREDLRSHCKRVESIVSMIREEISSMLELTGGKEVLHCLFPRVDLLITDSSMLICLAEVALNDIKSKIA